MSNNVTITGDLTVSGSASLSSPSIGTATGTSLDVTGSLQGATVTADATSNQVVLGTTNTTTISSTAPAASRTVTLHDAGGNSNFVLDRGGAMTITDTPAGANEILISSSTTASAWGTTLPAGAAPNLTGPITSTGVATAVASQTGTGSTFVMQATPTLTTPVIGAATGTSLSVSGALTAQATTNQVVLGTTNTTTISSTAPSASRTVTLHDAGGNSNIVLDRGGAMTITDAPAGANEVLVSSSTTAATWETSLDIAGTVQGATLKGDATTNQIVLGTTNTTTISSTAPSSSRTVTLHDAGGNSNFVLDSGGAMTITNSATSGYVLTATSSTAATWQAASGGSLQSTTVAITSANLKALTSGVQLISAPGAGNIIVPVCARFDFTYVAPQYTLGQAIYLTYAASATYAAVPYLAANTDIRGTANFSTVINLGTSTQYLNVTNGINAPLYLYASGNYATGNGTGSITIYYIVM